MRRITTYQNRPLSPIRTPNRSRSPFNRPTYNAPAPLSPLRTRRFERTPKKFQGQHKIFYRSPVNTNNYVSQQTGYIKHQKQKDHMQQTIKNGVGLFQNLTQQSKLNSDKKQNKTMYGGSNSKNNTTNASNTPSKQSSHQNAQPKPFQCSEKHKQNTMMNNKFSFTALLQNVKQIQSINGFYDETNAPNINSNQVDLKNMSFKTLNKSNKAMIETQSKHETKNWYENDRQASNGKESNLLTFESKMKKKSSKIQDAQINRQEKRSDIRDNKKKYQECFEPQQKVLENLEEINKIEEVSEDYDDVFLLIKKVSENNRVKEQASLEELVKMSLADEDSFNMKPFL